ncbi:MAG: epoxyqueuosine reductase QueH [Clostridia bacterium]|nr:epoxyqueuosine reductase QueH [Clostridia bacterium]
MNVKINYQKELDKLIENIPPDTKLLLHSCCAPCSSYVISYLSNYMDITVFYYNPNITEQEEYNKRAKEQQRLISEMPTLHKVSFMEGIYDDKCFFEAVKGYENCKEGGDRCKICYRLRLEETARVAELEGFDYFSTTLTISPLKNASAINEIGYDLAKKYGINWLPSDFKKNEGYKKSIELSKKYSLYRQNYCGCVFSLRDIKNDQNYNNS